MSVTIRMRACAVFFGQGLGAFRDDVANRDEPARIVNMFRVPLCDPAAADDSEL